MKFEIILADPPWPYQGYAKKEGWRTSVSHYKTMSIDDIKSLNIASIAAENCALFLWSTGAMLPTTIAIMEVWGFRYKTMGFVFIKTNKDGTYKKGMGWWTRQNAEFCLLGLRGQPRRVDASVHSVVVAPFTRHSAKPPIVRKRIVQLMGDVPRVELFARQENEYVEGWIRTGLECDGMDIRDFIRMCNAEPDGGSASARLHNRIVQNAPIIRTD